MKVEGSGLGVRGRNFAVLLTPPGGAAIAVVRLVGAGVGAFLEDHFDKAVRPGRCVHGTLHDGGRVVDDPMIVVSGDGTVADLSVHGGPWVVRSLLELVRRRGFDELDPVRAPVHEVAVKGGDEIAREVAQYLPLATTELALRSLLAQPAAWHEAAEAGSAQQCTAAVADRSLYWLLHPPRVAIIGVPNVGKSTLANQLLARDRLITSNVAGTTRDWVGEPANLDGLAAVLVDTPGVRETTDEIEREAIERSREQVAGADLVVVVLDATQPREPAQAALEREHPGALRVVNKSDLNRAGAWDQAIQTVATTGEGVDSLRDAIRARFLGPAPYDLARRRWWTPRQKDFLTRPRPATA